MIFGDLSSAAPRFFIGLLQLHDISVPHAHFHILAGVAPGTRAPSVCLGRPSGCRESGSQAAFSGMPVGGPPVPQLWRQFGDGYAESALPADLPQACHQKPPDCSA